MTDANANVVAKTDYKAYGGVADNQQKSEAPGYTGQYEDPLTGLTHMQQRYYDSDLGRFISADLIAARAGDVFNFNRYAYAANSPLNFIDPTGMDYCAAYVNGVAAGIGYCGDSSDSLGQGGSRNSNAGGGSAGGPGGGGGSIPTEKPVNVTANVPAKSWYCSRGAADVAGSVAGGSVGGALTAMVDLRGNPYGIVIGALAGGVAAGAVTGFNNQIVPYVGGPAGGMISNMLASAISDRNSASVAINGIASYAGSVIGINPNVTTQMISRSAPYAMVTTLATAPTLGKGALVAGPMIGLASGITDYATEVGWNNACGN
ncbi:RHS repeat-associated core domain-containing protein [Dyella monticola]|uniref:RHS repeat-associated core domain-containing protein n=1 Tax=Dyella monticola TaxID=1927958 RepID=A0A370X5U8_9GAMM|nr:RHS repeat-associated core domain-containing protein [Dyella monticola]RDS83758.1 RHS repeat-associated core domain-containing protein [Dyella monticola]